MPVLVQFFLSPEGALRTAGGLKDRGLRHRAQIVEELDYRGDAGLLRKGISRRNAAAHAAHLRAGLTLLIVEVLPEDGALALHILNQPRDGMRDEAARPAEYESWSSGAALRRTSGKDRRPVEHPSGSPGEARGWRSTPGERPAVRRFQPAIILTLLTKASALKGARLRLWATGWTTRSGRPGIGRSIGFGLPRLIRHGSPLGFGLPLLIKSAPIGLGLRLSRKDDLPPHGL
jgi:hypothetical protein